MWLRSKIKNVLLKGSKQYATGAYIGAAMDTYARTAIVVGAIQFMNTIIILYSTSVKPLELPWLNFYLYISIFVIVVAIFMVIVYKIALPSNYEFHNIQVWKHPNPMKDAILLNRKKIEDVQKQLTSIKRMIEKIDK